MGIAQDLAYELRIFFPRVPFRALADFTGNLATCVEAGLGLPESLETCTRSCPNLLLRSCGKAAAAKVRSGVPLSEAFGEIARFLPTFYLPVVRSGEQSGRLDEALQYLQHHCAMLERPYQAARSLWLVPLVLFVLTDVVVSVAHFFVIPFFSALWYLIHRLMNYLVLAAAVLLVLNVPPLRRLWDQLLLAIPFLGSILRDLGVNRFLNVFSLMYRTSGRTVANMVEMSCMAVDNTAIREDFLRAVPGLKGGESFSSCLAGSRYLTFEQKAAIESAEQAGRLEDALATICRQTYESLQLKFATFRRYYFHVIYGLSAYILLTKLSGLITMLVMRIGMR